VVLTQNLVAHYNVLLLHQSNYFQCECRDVGGEGLSITIIVYYPPAVHMLEVDSRYWTVVI